MKFKWLFIQVLKLKETTGMRFSWRSRFYRTYYQSFLWTNFCKRNCLHIGELANEFPYRENPANQTNFVLDWPENDMFVLITKRYVSSGHALVKAHGEVGVRLCSKSADRYAQFSCQKHSNIWIRNDDYSKCLSLLKV